MSDLQGLYRTLPLVPSLDSEKNICLRVQDQQFTDQGPVSFDEMSERGWDLISIVPINAFADNWKGVAVFKSNKINDG